MYCSGMKETMTSLISVRIVYRQTSRAAAACRHYTTMNRDISPPPAKRRKTSMNSLTTPHQTAPPSKNPAPLPPLSSNTLRIFSWNINGITPFLQRPIISFFQPSKPKTAVKQDAKDAKPAPSLRAFLHKHQWPSILFLQEVKIAHTDEQTQDAVRKAIKTPLPEESTTHHTDRPLYQVHFILPTDLHNARGPGRSGKVYGVCSLVRRDLYMTYKITMRTVDWDSEGRISVLELRSKTTKAKVAIFNIYAVNGTDNPYRDPATGAYKGTRHDRKRKFLRLLAQECKELEDQGWDVLLAGDMNVAPDKRDGYPKLRIFPQAHVINRVEFHDKLLGGSGKAKDAFTGVDVWREMHPDERRYTYFSKGRKWGSSCDRVDYFIAGKKAWEKGCVTACGIMDTEEDMEPSDHVPIWADFEIKEGNERGTERADKDGEIKEGPQS
jgi:exonuclease III